MEELATGIASNAICGVFNKVYKEIKNLYHLGTGVDWIESQLPDLEARKTDIKNQLQTERRAPLETVERWLAKAEHTRTTVQEIRTDYNLHMRCWIAGCCPDCIFCLKLTRRVRDCKSNIQRIFEEYGHFNGQFGGIPLISPSVFVPMRDAVGAAMQRDQQQIEGWLINDDTIRVVGVYGMPGVGKTTLLQIINNSQNVQSAFDIVISVTISQNPNTKEVLTGVVNERLRLSLPRDSSEQALRARLHEFLREKKFLLILDDVWGTVELEDELGVPFNEGRGKIILSTRTEEVTRGMNANRMIKVHPLTPEEGWQLFRSRAFGDENLNNVPAETQGIAREVAAECNGLPLAIKVIAAAMPRMDDPSAWRFALRQLRNVDHTFYDDRTYIDKQLFQCLRWSYDDLSRHQSKVCFLICSFYPEDSWITRDDLITQWIAEELVEGREEDYLYDQGLNLLKIFRDRCLIGSRETGTEIMHIRVHDVLRDFAIRIAEKEENCLVRAGQNVETFPTERETQLCKRMSLRGNKISSLPPTFACPNLVTLMLGHNEGLEEVPESFFHNLPSLKALNLQKTKIKSLPASVGLLKQLVFLDLSYTDIEELPESMGNLIALRFLFLHNCWELKYLPSAISKLKCLKTLNLIRCEKLTVVPAQISQITSLENLDMYYSGVFVGEGSFSAEFQESKEMCFKDLVNFRRLRRLRLHIKSPIGNGVTESWIKMRLLWLICGDGIQKNLPEDMPAMQELEDFYLRGCDVVTLPRWIFEFKNLKTLRLCNCKQLKEVSALETLPRLTWLDITSCDEMMSDFSERFGKAGSFPTLENLKLKDLPSLESLVKKGVDGKEELQEGALPRLKMLLVLDCPNLKRFPLGMERLRRLEKIMGTQEWWGGMAFPHDDSKRCLEKLYVKWPPKIMYFK